MHVFSNLLVLEFSNFFSQIVEFSFARANRVNKTNFTRSPVERTNPLPLRPPLSSNYDKTIPRFRPSGRMKKRKKKRFRASDRRYFPRIDVDERSANNSLQRLSTMFALQLEINETLLCERKRALCCFFFEKTEQRYSTFPHQLTNLFFPVPIKAKRLVPVRSGNTPKVFRQVRIQRLREQQAKTRIEALGRVAN